MSETVERHGFGAEVGRLLDLVLHALYIEREIFLRELVANAADAVDRRRPRGGLVPPPLASATDAGPMFWPGSDGNRQDTRRPLGRARFQMRRT